MRHQKTYKYFPTSSGASERLSEGSKKSERAVGAYKRAAERAAQYFRPDSKLIYKTTVHTWENNSDVVLFANLGDVSAFASDQKFVEFRVRFQFFAMPFMIKISMSMLNSSDTFQRSIHLWYQITYPLICRSEARAVSCFLAFATSSATPRIVTLSVGTSILFNLSAISLSVYHITRYICLESLVKRQKLRVIGAQQPPTRMKATNFTSVTILR